MSGQAYGRRVLESETASVRVAEQGTRSDTASRAAYRLGQLTEACGLDPHEVESELVDAAIIAGLSEWEARTTVKASLRKGEQKPRHPRPDVTSKDHARDELATLATLALAQDWSGLRGKRGITILMGLLDIGREQGSMEINVPLVRLLLTIGSRNRQQAQRGLRDLVEDGWLLRVSRGGPGHAARYRLRFPTDVFSQATTTQPPNKVWPDYAQTIGQIGADVYRSGGIDKTAWRILRHLAEKDDWSTQVGIADALGISPSTVSRLCGPRRRLTIFGLVTRSTERRGSVRLTRWASPSFMDLVAARKGTAGEHDHDRLALIERYINLEYLTQDLHWIDQHTGEPTRYRADWLLPLGPPQVNPADVDARRPA